MTNNIPFNGPVASLRIGMKDGQFTVDPGENEEGDLELNIACNPDAVLMVEAGANFLAEEKMLDAIDYARELMKPLFAAQLKCRKPSARKSAN